MRVPRDPAFVCYHCQRAECADCVDVERAVRGYALVCECGRFDHSTTNKVFKLENSDVYSPELVAESNGIV